MITVVVEYITAFFQLGVFFYALVIVLSYIGGAITSFGVLRNQNNTEENIDLNVVNQSSLLPSISIIAPAYNEERTIVENIRSLLSLSYNELNIIVVNDGSKDETLKKAIESFDLVAVDYLFAYRIECKEIRNVYKSRNKAFKKLTFVDKANGGKADALNAGMNVSYADYFACIDVDCVIEQDAFEQLILPVLNSQKEVIAVGGIVWLNNDCKVVYGKIKEVMIPSNIWARFQLLEYFRAFLMGRTAWSSLNGLLIISGAFGIFKRERVIEVGGYSTKTVGEDMELVMRLHRKMLEMGATYKIAYLAKPLCWTEAPESLKVLSRQRNRWTRGTIECLMVHKKLFFNRKYGIIGMLSYPYWLFVEWLAPYVEAIGLVFTILMLLFGMINVQFFLMLMAATYSLVVFISLMSILSQHIFIKRYTKPRQHFKLFITACIEPFIYHPLTVYWALKGNYDLFIKKSSSWGEMTRTGYKKVN